MSLGHESYSVTFILPRNPLLTWDGWNSNMKAWIGGQGEDIGIVEVVDVYARMAGEFDKWLFDRIGIKYVPEIDAFMREQEEYTREFDRVFGA